ncbi:MAG: hypothetical protein KDC16_05490 [Saprospiraceae bacterium]|nr:hypothetical protein [Saprospiraceae bacterium]HPK09509.1 hypothetical protein [Saprospiraceae bacterium]
MELKVIEDYSNYLKSVQVEINGEGLFEIEVSILNYRESIDKNTMSFQLVGIKNSEVFSFDLVLKRFGIVYQNQNKEFFIPARIGLIPPKDFLYRKPFFNFIFNSKTLARYDFVDFIGVGLELNRSEKYGYFNLERLFNEKIVAKATNEVKSSSKKYLEFGIEFNFPIRRVRFFETNIKYRDNIINSYILKRNDVDIPPKEENQTSDYVGKLKNKLFGKIIYFERKNILQLTLFFAMIGYMAYAIIKLQTYWNSSIMVEAIVVDKVNADCENTGIDSLFIDVKYVSNVGKYYHSKVFIDKKLYEYLNVNDTILIKYKKSNPSIVSIVKN